MHDGLVVGRELHDPLEHRGVEPERRARVDDREDRRLAIELLGVDAARDADHLEGVDVALPSQAVGVDRLVHQGQRVERGVEVADAVVEVDRLDRVAGEEVDRVERLAQAEQVLVVGAIADPPAAVEVGDVGRAADRPERDPVAAELQVVLGVPGVQGERRRRGPDQLRDHVRVEPHAQRALGRSGRRPPAGPRAPRHRGSPCRSRTGRAGSRGGWPPARRPTRPRSGGSASGAGPRAAAAAARSGHGPPGHRRGAAAGPRPRASPYPSRRPPRGRVVTRRAGAGRPPVQL